MIVGSFNTNATKQLNLVANNSARTNSADIQNILRIIDTDGTIVPNQPIGGVEFVSVDATFSGVVSSILAWGINSNGGAELRFATGNAGAAIDQMWLKGTGDLGLGTNTPAAKLHVVGNARVDGNITNSGTLSVGGDITASGYIQTGTSTAVATNTTVGAIRYRVGTTNSFAEMVMQTNATEYGWVELKRVEW